ncbi:hypothetical protein GGR58DRAFT_308386 [Xylaria digitata]|nr:hypothetical protein GGR58DRAFT_308386 [Xylaria digitata]
MHKDTLHTMFNIALVFQNQGKIDEALSWYQRALVWYQWMFGDKHRCTIDAAYSIAVVLYDHGKLDEALTRCQQLLLGRQEVLVEDDRRTSRTKNLIARIRSRSDKEGRLSPPFPRVSTTS